MVHNSFLRKRKAEVCALNGLPQGWNKRRETWERAAFPLMAAGMGTCPEPMWALHRKSAREPSVGETDRDRVGMPPDAQPRRKSSMWPHGTGLALGICLIQRAPASSAHKTFCFSGFRSLHPLWALRRQARVIQWKLGGVRGVGGDKRKTEEQGWETEKLSSGIRFEGFYNYSGLDISVAKMRLFLWSKVTRLLSIICVIRRTMTLQISPRNVEEMVNRGSEGRMLKLLSVSWTQIQLI